MGARLIQVSLYPNMSFTSTKSSVSLYFYRNFAKNHGKLGVCYDAFNMVFARGIHTLTIYYTKEIDSYISSTPNSRCFFFFFLF